MAIKFYLILAALTVLAVPVQAGGPWPEGLKEEVNSHFQALQVAEYIIRDSTLENPKGIQPMAAFDRASHKCHEIPGQVYRVYRVPSSFKLEDDGIYIVRSSYELYYRQAEDLTGIFSEPWKRGSDGAVQVRFNLVGEEWEVVESREVLE